MVWEYLSAPCHHGFGRIALIVDEARREFSLSLWRPQMEPAPGQAVSATYTANRSLGALSEIAG
jgi:hypothetical protein